MSERHFSRRQVIATSAAWLTSRGVCAANAAEPHVAAVAFTPDGKQIIAGSQAGVSIRDRQSGASLRTIATEMDNVHDLRFAPDGQLVAIAGGIPGESGVVLRLGLN